MHLPEFKVKVGLEAVRGIMTIKEIGQAHGVHPVQVSQWRKEIQEQAKTLFEGKLGPQPVAAHRVPNADSSFFEADIRDLEFNSLE